MLARRSSKLHLFGLAALIAVGCAVFPDSATLPLQAEAGAAGGSDVEPGAGQGGVQTGGTSAEGGAPGIAGQPGELGGAPPEPMAGAAGAPACAAQPRTLKVDTDTWIESQKPTVRHGNDKLLYVTGFAQQRRALLAFTLPAAPAGAQLIEGTLRLQLDSNADPDLGERVLEVHPLLRSLDEAQASWDSWTNGNNPWDAPGGDFGPVLASATIAAGTTNGSVTFDLTEALAEVFSTSAVPLSLIVLEVGPEPTSLASLAFASREGDALTVPRVLIQYCLP